MFLKHAMVIRFGLEGNVIGMPRDVYNEIIAHDVPGPNSTTEKANNLRSFAIPERFKSPCSSGAVRTINILFAFVSDIWVWTIVDFTRLAQGHVISRDKFWNSQDFDTSSKVCSSEVLKNIDASIVP